MKFCLKILRITIFLITLQSCFKIYVPKDWPKDNNPLMPIPENWLARI